MKPETFLAWWPLWTSVVVWIFTAGYMWARIMDKLNGLGRRVGATEKALGGLPQMQDNLAEYRREAQTAAIAVARLEKGMEAVADAVREGNTAMGVQLHGIEKLIEAKDLRTQTRLVRIETVNEIEKKVGPIPID